jgi:hypothetical protein
MKMVRHTRANPCEVCHGYDQMPRGRDERCYGFTNGLWCHCTRVRLAGELEQNSAGTFAHRLRGRCGCGCFHGDRDENECKRRCLQADEQERLRRRIELARRLWERGRPIAGTIAALYLRTRAITLVPGPAELRFEPALIHPPSQRFLPALLAPLRDTNGCVAGIHRTFLRENGSGKAEVEPSRMMLGRAKGAAIRFGEGTEIILTEGLENALSVREVIGLPAWAAGSLAGLKNVALPQTVRLVTIFADPKPHERRGAEEAARRLIREGRQARIAYPPGNRDVNDLLRSA